ncbi:MAG TPA: glycosyltransferase family 4 protein [bacterium]|nr:glycosyltransferase family 4 protein [bacterium]HPQ66225.1 glycosyltransferase family 4 protein [bacterium]
MRVAFCIENFVPARGGAEQYVKDLSLLFCREGHEVTVITMRSDVEPEEKLSILRVGIPRRPKFLRTLVFAWKCRSLVRKGDYDVVHSFGRTLGMDVFQPLGGSQMAGLVGNLRSIDNPLKRFFKILCYIFSFRRIAYFIIEKLQMKTARVVVAISGMVKNDVLRYTRLGRGKIRIVRNGVDLERFHPRNRELYRSEVRNGLGLSPDDILILFVAHNFRLKGLRPLLQALAVITETFPEKPFILGVLGEGKKKRFRTLARKWGVEDRVRFIGLKMDTSHYYAAADICVHPSFYDPSALVVLEAMASGIPVITTMFCGTSEIISEGREGYVVNTPNDIADMAEKIMILADPEARRRMGRQARSRAEEAPYVRNMQAILGIHNEYCRPRS